VTKYQKNPIYLKNVLNKKHPIFILFFKITAVEMLNFLIALMHALFF